MLIIAAKPIKLDGNINKKNFTFILIELLSLICVTCVTQKT